VHANSTRSQDSSEISRGLRVHKAGHGEVYHHQVIHARWQLLKHNATVCNLDSGSGLRVVCTAKGKVLPRQLNHFAMQLDAVDIQRGTFSSR
jgi:hypothetical protein